MLNRAQIPGQVMDLVGGSSDGDTFFVAENAIKADAFDGVTTRPMDVGGGKTAVFAYITVIGTDAHTGEPAGVTLMMRTDMLFAIAKGARTLWANVPIHFREKDDDKRDDSAEVTRALPEG